ncbi:MAG: hypothetical protein IJF53_01690 [Clostridia bacterium]|nr:hypothetical protein [Clostridia bacterium]
MQYERKNNYQDIIGMPHHVSLRHRPMTRLGRAAQFAPFAALTGYEDAILETGRLTSSRRELGEDTKTELDRRQALLMARQKGHPYIKAVYFKADIRKKGGAYLSVSGNVLKVTGGMMIFTDGTVIPMKDITVIDGDIFKEI